MGTVLVADDDPDVRQLVAFKLRQAGHEVIVVGDGPSAIAAAGARPVDLAVLDVTMPGLSGLEVCAALRADARTAAVPVILLSARAHEGDAQRGLQAGAVAYVTKPFSPRELVDRVECLLNGAR
ncbi:MAG TPA: response regulator [Jatrophihabitans sp.]|nr:response regulator [Jatrophihabitans sp.]